MSVDAIIEAQKKKLEMWKLAEKQEELDEDPVEVAPDEFTCPICYEEMSTPSRRPMICIPCGHTICQTCMAAASKVNAQKCPFCGGRIESKPAVNYALQNAIEKHAKNPVGAAILPNYDVQLETTKERLALLVRKLQGHQTRAAAVKKELETEQKVLDVLSEEMQVIIAQHHAQEVRVGELRKEDSELREEIGKLKSVIDPLVVEMQKLELLAEGTRTRPT